MGGNFASDEEDQWLDEDSEAAMRAVVPGWMGARSLALYARWWQLETWLRELIYVELRATFGVKWEDVVKAATGRKNADASFTHMSGPDNGNPLAYLDYSQLLEIIDTHWPKFALALIEANSWKGRQEELKRIRHRIGHLRKPHPDDLSRLEQTLRDLERGTFVALASYNKRSMPDPRSRSDAVTRGWVAGEHRTAKRLIEHADRQYETRLRVETSRRPWASMPTDLTGAEGILWHAEFIMSNRNVDPRTLWAEIDHGGIRDILVHLVFHDPYSVGFTFAAVDDGDDIADAIGAVFEAILTTSRPISSHSEVDYRRAQSRARAIDYRVQSGTGWCVVDETTVPITHFGSGGGVDSKVIW
ncbi:hypothetical protein AB0G00_26450 [Nocardia salmonicida]|uniref:hypothetical protein n=1 Tax=Nocardia salmonicida TaxID=53431 RepID=UPI003409E2CB